MNFSISGKLLLLGILLCIVVVFAISKGSVAIPFFDLFSEANRPILYLRLNRIMLGIFAGAGLSICGVVLQAILRNPLAEPYLLGTSSGAGLGAVIAIILGVFSTYLPLAAFGGALISIILVYALAREDSTLPVQSLILCGVIVAVAFSGLVVFLVSVSSSEALHGIMWWILGSLQIYEFKPLLMVGALVTLGTICISVFAQDINAISLGEEEAIHLGIEIEKIKKLLFLITSLITGALVAISGMIGFVGLIIPHFIRLIVGPNHKVLIPAAVLGGAAFLVLCDTLSRSLIPPLEIPIGVVTSLIGAPLFIVILKRKQRIKIK